MARMKEASIAYTMNVPTDADSLGRLLGESKLDGKRLGMDMGLRALIAVLAIFVWNWKGQSSPAVMWILYAGLAVLVLYPLVHLGDSMEFYENGVKYKNSTYLFRSRNAEWIRREGVGHIISGVYLYLGGQKNGFNASYLQTPDESFARAYQGRLSQ